MRYDILASQLRQDPRRYLWFGPWWWTIKKAMAAAGENFGPEDDTYARTLMESTAPTPEDAIKRAMRHYDRMTGAFRNHDFTLPNGQPYFLNDPDVLMHARA